MNGYVIKFEEVNHCDHVNHIYESTNSTQNFELKTQNFKPLHLRHYSRIIRR